jgi:RNase P/RNase MRP subunit p29
MAGMMQLPWLARNIVVIDSTDPTLLGVSGTIQDETRRTITVKTEGGAKTMAKDTIRFTIDEFEIDGKRVCQRPEDRVGKRFRGQ